MKIRSYPVRGASLLAAALLATIAATPASAADHNWESSEVTPYVSHLSTDGQLDPKTFSGPVLIATQDGEVLTTVKKGELETIAAEIRKGVAEGSIETSGMMQPMGGCGDWEDAVAGPFGYANSLNGCAVFGYTGYWRSYQWTNTSSVSICVQSKGFLSAYPNNTIWGGMGCSESGGSGSIHWGNILAYTQVRGLSLSGVTGATYQWWD